MQNDPVVAKASELLRLGGMPSPDELRSGKVGHHDGSCAECVYSRRCISERFGYRHINDWCNINLRRAGHGCVNYECNCTSTSKTRGVISIIHHNRRLFKTFCSKVHSTLWAVDLTLVFQFLHLQLHQDFALLNIPKSSSWMPIFSSVLRWAC